MLKTVLGPNPKIPKKIPKKSFIEAFFNQDGDQCPYLNFLACEQTAQELVWYTIWGVIMGADSISDVNILNTPAAKIWKRPFCSVTFVWHLKETWKADIIRIAAWKCVAPKFK